MAEPTTWRRDDRAILTKKDGTAAEVVVTTTDDNGAVVWVRPAGPMAFSVPVPPPQLRRPADGILVSIRCFGRVQRHPPPSGILPIFLTSMCTRSPGRSRS